MKTFVQEARLLAPVQARLQQEGVDAITAQAVAASMVGAERDGTLSHGLHRLDACISSVRSGWVVGDAPMQVQDLAASLVRVDAARGFAQGALARARDLVARKARETGMCTLAIGNSHHIGCLWHDVEQFAQAGFVCFAFVHSRSRVVGPGARSKVLGTNPMAFGFPRQNGLPVVWDQASSVMAHGEVQLAARHGHALPEGVGVDRNGEPTTDAAEVLNGGALTTFASHKGFMIALMVEVMAAALTGSKFGFEDESGQIPGAQTSLAGQTFLVIDPLRIPDTNFPARVELLLEALRDAGTERMPGDRRYASREAAQQQGIAVDAKALGELTLGEPVQRFQNPE